MEESAVPAPSIPDVKLTVPVEEAPSEGWFLGEKAAPRDYELVGGMMTMEVDAADGDRVAPRVREKARRHR